jgi:hypothetical protein
MKLKLVALAALALSALTAAGAPANATISIGDTLDVQYNFPGLGSIYGDSGDFTYTGAGQSVLSGGITTVFLGGSEVIFANDQSGLNGNTFSNGFSFNGPIVTDLTNGSAFSGWSVTSATAGYTSAYLTGGAIGVDWSGQLYNGGAVTVSASGAPEPSTWAMTILGFAGLGFAGSRKAKGAALFAA